MLEKWMARDAVRATADEGAGGGGGDGGGAPPKWFEDARFAEQKDWMTAKGLLTVEDPLAALEKTIVGHHNAEKALGKPADSILDKPKTDQPLVEWMRANAGVFGLPEAADKYAIEKPTLPDGVKWDEAFEAKAREIAFEHGVPPKALQAFVGAYGERVAGLLGDAEAQLQAATAEMRQALEREWGAQTTAKIAAARAAVAVVAEKAKLDQDAVGNLMLALKEKVGDPGIMKLFATLGEMLGEDTLAGTGDGAGGMAMTPAEARQQLTLMDSPEGEYGRAYMKGDRATMAALEPKRQALLKIMGSKG